MGLMDLVEKTAGFVTLTLTSGKQNVSNNFLTNDVQIHSGSEPNRVYFGSSSQNQFEIINYNWSGPQWREKMVTDTVAVSKSREKRKGHIAGAIIGTVLLPGAGTVIGALHGTGKKTVGATTGHEESHVEQEEITTPANMSLMNVSTGENIAIGFMCNTALDSKLRTLIPDLTAIDVQPSEEQIETQGSALDQIKKLKELLDCGAITQEEFDAKKKQLLSL